MRTKKIYGSGVVSRQRDERCCRYYRYYKCYRNHIAPIILITPITLISFSLYLTFILERKRTIRRAAIFTCSPVRGLRPMRSDTLAVEKTPKPDITTFSFCSNFCSVISNRESKTRLTSFFERAVFSATSLISCDLFIRRVVCYVGLDSLLFTKLVIFLY